MQAQIRHLLTPDIDPDTFVPHDPDRFAFLVQMLAGPVDEPGEESFQFEICTPGWLHQQIQRDGPINGRHHVIVDTFNWPALQNYFQHLVTRCTGATWHEVATKLARYGYWEFEDYTPTTDQATPAQQT